VIDAEKDEAYTERGDCFVKSTKRSEEAEESVGEKGRASVRGGIIANGRSLGERKALIGQILRKIVPAQEKRYETL